MATDSDAGNTKRADAQTMKPTEYVSGASFNQTGQARKCQRSK